MHFWLYVKKLTDLGPVLYFRCREASSHISWLRNRFVHVPKLFTIGDCDNSEQFQIIFQSIL